MKLIACSVGLCNNNGKENSEKFDQLLLDLLLQQLQVDEEFIDDGSVKRVDIYDMGKTAVATVDIAGRNQELVCDLPGASTGEDGSLQTVVGTWGRLL